MSKTFVFENPVAINDTATLLKRWLENRNNGLTFDDYLKKCGYLSVVIFDAGEIGRLLYEELKNTEIEVKCFYDRNAEGINSMDGIPVYPFSKLNDIPEADIVLVSPLYNYSEVMKKLLEIDVNIQSLYLKDAVYEF